MNEEELTAHIERLDELLTQLGEHFEHIQVLATWQEGHNSCRLFRGYGNWYARQGLAHSFINLDVAQDSAKEISRFLPPVDSGDAQ